MSIHAAIQHELRGHLQELLKNKQAKNNQYSLRAFSRSLGVPHSTLSLYFRGQRKLSKQAVEKICRQIDWKTEEISKIFEVKANSDHSFHNMELDQYELISDWSHYAILSLTRITNFKMSSETIAERLGIDIATADESFNRLVRMGLLCKARNGKWIQSTLPIKVDNKVSTMATRRAQKKIIERSLESLEKDSMEERDFNAVMFAMDKNLLPLAKEKIQKFRRKLMSDLEAAGSANEVYMFSMQLFPVSQKKENP